MKLRVMYFAWLRERIGEGQETLETSATTPTALVQDLRTKDPRYAAAFEDITAVRVSVDQELVDWDYPLRDGAEVAFFPPMTGG